MGLSLEEIEKITKGKRELHDILEQKIKALQELNNVLDDIDSGTKKLKQLMGDKKKFLEGRDQEAREIVADTTNALVKARDRINKASGEIGEWLKKATDTVEEVLKEATETIRKAGEILERAAGVEKTFEAAAGLIKERTKQAEALLIKNSNTEKALAEREREVEKKSKDADATLEEAKRIAFWHGQKDVKITTT